MIKQLRSFLSFLLVLTSLTLNIFTDLPKADAAPVGNCDGNGVVGESSNSGFYTVKYELTTAANNAGTGSTCSFAVPTGVTQVEFLSVSGGGGGGHDGGGGGGGGGVLYYKNWNVTPGNSISVVVGAGGAPAGTSCSSGNCPEGGNGTLSSFNSQSVQGGGGGGGRYSSGNSTQGSGGGAGHTNDATVLSGGNSTADTDDAYVTNGNDGGANTSTYGGGGGGSASSTSGRGSTGGNGGIGFYSEIEGSGVYYGGGGGGGTYTANSRTSGGSGGGGAGGNSSNSGANGTNGLGGGAGGGGDGSRFGGRGGGGVVIVRYQNSCSISSPATYSTGVGSNSKNLVRITASNSSSSCTGSWSVPANVTSVEVFVLGGGGGGGGKLGGGGGSGGGINNTNYSVTAGASISLTIGGGGRGGYGAWDRSASSGSSSIFGTLEAYGGGAGADEYDTGANGGSGGGAGGGNSSATFGSATQATGSGTKYGSNGGAKSGLANAYGGGGGGGVNGAGGAASSTTGGTGGNGITIYGYTLGGGGGGGVNTSTGAGSATAGGGAGGNNSGTPQSGGNGTAGTGGGGGGGANNGAVFGGDGGSGVIIILYTTNLTLTFNSNYGTPTTSTQTIPSNTATNLTANSFTRTGYIFSSWNTLANGSGTSYQNTSSISISTNTTLYAQWRQSFLITTSAGTYSEIDASPSVASGDSVTVNFGVNPSYSTGFSLTSVVVDGVALTGSALTTAISNGSYTFLNVTTTHTISVEETGNTFSITYKAGSSGTGSDDVQSFIYGSVPTYKTGAATGITRSGYTVLYWDETDGGVGGVRAPGGSYYSPANLILYPVWRANTNNAITYDNQGATTSHSGGSITYTTATNISTIPTTAPIKTGFTFAGWYTAASGGTRVTNNSYRPPSPYGAITLYAQWTGDALTPSLGTPSPNADGFTVSVTNFDGNFTYSFTLTNGASAAIDANGLITVSNLTAGSSSALTVTTSRSGYTSGVGSVTGSTLAVFTVTFLANNGSGSMSPQSSQVSTILNSNSFTRTKYNFVSWNTSADGSGTTYLDGANFNFSSNISLYATWIAIPTITSQPNSVSKDAGDSASFSVTTTAVDGGTLSYQWQKDGLNILGANSDNLTINSISSGSAGDYQVIITNTKNGNTSTITSNVAVLTVTIPTYSVTYSAPDAGSGSVPTDSSSPYTYNSTVTLLGNTGSLTRTGYVFTGWRTAADATLRLGGSSYQITFDTTFIAVWTRIYQLTLDSNGGSGTMSALDGPSVTIPNNTFTRSGYTFKEWNSASNGTGDIFTVNLTLTLTQAVKLYAIWNAVPSNVITFNTISSQTYGQTLDLSSYVSASSGLTVTATSNTTQICTISGLTLTAIGAGTCSITASQPGDGSNAAASNVTRSFTVNKKSLTISVGDISANFGSTISNPTYTQSGLVSSLGDVIATPTYYYSGTSSTYYGRSTTKPTAVGSYLISMLSLSLSSGSTANYQVSFVSGNLSIASVASSNVSAIILKRASGDTSSNLITNFDNSRTSYSVYVAADVSAVVASITRPNGTVSSAQVKINDSGWRKLTFKSNEASTGVLPLPSSTNTLKISTISNDKGTKEFTITIYRDTKTAPTGGSAATPAPTTTATPADNAVSSVIFLVNNPSGNSSGLQQVDISPTFSRTTYSYTATFSNIQSATMMKADFTASGVTLKLKINNGAFTSIPNTGYSSTISLNVGSNSAILRVTSSDASSVDYTFTLSRAAALSGLTPTFSSPSAITGGFTVQISNYSNSYNWSVSASNGTASIDNSGLVTVTGVTGSSTITVISRRSGYTNARSTLTYP